MIAAVRERFAAMARSAWAEIDVGNEADTEEFLKEETLQYTEMCIIEQHCVSQGWILRCPSSRTLSHVRAPQPLASLGKN